MARKVQITIPAAQVGTASAVTGFTVQLTEASLPAEIFTLARSDGGDIRAYADAALTQQLALDVIRFDTASTTSLFSVGTINLSSATANSIYLSYADSSLTAQPAANTTYGQYAAYDTNWKLYLPEASGTDRTSNQNTLTATGTPVDAAGKLERAYNYTGNAYESRTTSILGNTPAALTMMCWAKGSWASGATLICLGNSTNSIGILFGCGATTNKLRIFERADSTSITPNLESTPNAFDGTNFYHCATTYDGTTYTIAVNAGTPQTATTTPGTATLNRTSVSCALRSSAGNFFTGIIDEVQVHDTARSAAWLTTYYNMTNAPGTFATAGTPESAGLPRTRLDYIRRLNGV